MASLVSFENSKSIEFIKKNKTGMTTTRLFSCGTKNQVEVEFTGTFATNGVNESKFDGKTNWSFGFKFDDKEHIKGLKYLLEPFGHPVLDSWSRAPLTKEGLIFFKLKRDEFDEFAVKTNCDGELEEVEKGTPVTVKALVHAYFDLEKKIYGIYYNVTNLEF